MTTVGTRDSGQAGERWSAPWGRVLVALGLSLGGTVVLGGVLFLLQPNVWWIALAGLLSLFGAGAYLARATQTPEPLYGALLAILYFGITAGALFGGTLAEALPEPLPGLEIGDSTFFFVWPLLQLAAAVAGCVLGGLRARRSRNGGQAEAEEAL